MPGALPEGDPAPADGLLPASAAVGSAQRRFGVYVHVPYCRVRCGYCDFNTYTAAELGGTRRDVTRLIQGVPGLIAKDGAESVYAVGLADGRGIVVKIADGNDRARGVVTTAALRHLGGEDLGPDVAQVLEGLDAEAVVKGHGEPVGANRAVPLP